MLLGLATLPASAAPQLTSTLPGADADPTSVEAALQHAIRQNPESFEASYALGSFYASQDRITDAVAHLEMACRMEPEHYACGYDLALVYFKSGDLPKARGQIHAMLLRHKDAAELHNLLGAVEEVAGDIDTAAKELQQAAEMDPSEKHVFDFGNILLRYRAYDGALKILRYGVERYPRSAQLKVALGVALYSLSEYKGAVEALCEAVDLDPADSRALYFLGKMHDISPEMAAEVTRRLKGFARLYPENASANYFYATSLWKGSGQEAEAHLDEVERLLQRAVALDPAFHEAHFQLGALYQRLGRYKDAVRHYRRVTQLQPDLDSAYYRLGRVYQRLGQTDLAREAIEAYQRLHQQIQSEKEAAQPPGLIVK
jgi:tetratricopeptide (TPR) repeat protein